MLLVCGFGCVCWFALRLVVFVDLLGGLLCGVGFLVVGLVGVCCLLLA